MIAAVVVALISAVIIGMMWISNADLKRELFILGRNYETLRKNHTELLLSRHLAAPYPMEGE